jgi:hypothetical protein
VTLLRLVALGAALAVAGVLLGLPGPAQAPAGLPIVVVDMPGRLPDGTAFTPLYFLDPQTAVGTAPTPDRTAVRLVLRGDEGLLRELRRLPERSTPQFTGFTSTGDDLVWAESTALPDGRGETRLWRVSWRSADAPVELTADTGDAVFFNSQYDLVVADGSVHWVSAARGGPVVTEVRSVPLSGGPVSLSRVDGAFALSAWPWLVSAGTGAVSLRNLDSGEVVAVPSSPTEIVTCAAAWCRVLVLAGDLGPARLDLMRPDGTDRHRIAGGVVSASVTDVAILDRFEVLTVVGREGSATSNQQLLLYDIAARRTVTVAVGVGMVLCRGGVLWWSTGDNETLAWHAVDLRTLR